MRMPAPSTAPVVAVGAINADHRVEIPRLPQHGETLASTAHALLLGGKAANQAVALARLGQPVSLIGCVGDDPAGAYLRAQLAAEDVTTTGIRTAAGATGLAFVMVDAEGENAIVLSAGTNAAMHRDHLNDHVGAIADAPAVLLQLEIPASVSARAAELASGFVLLNAAPAGSVPSQLLDRADVVVVNEVEFVQLCASRHAPDDVQGFRRMARQHFPDKACVVTRGGLGCIVIDGDHAGQIPAVAVTAVDTTGAGDCFSAALLHCLLNGGDLHEAAHFATRAAALSVQRLGAATSFPRATELS
jgi:ribokinase